jgi:ferredoxin-type protein NapH
MYQQGQNGLDTTYREAWRKRGLSGWVFAFVLTAFYLVLYFTDHFKPIAENTGFSNQWDLYAALYCVAMSWGAYYYLKKHGNSRYNRIRIGVNLFVQFIFAFSLPIFMTAKFDQGFYFASLWPLNIDAFYPQTLSQLPPYLMYYTFAASLIAMPLLTYFFGKRWYCSWICGCGGLANTFGDPWRHLSIRSTASWKFEKIAIYAVMFLALFTTGIVTADFFYGTLHSEGSFFVFAGHVRGFYKFVIASILSGVVGVGIYPLLGPRVWCRFFCPMAAMLGLFQKLGRFHIKVKEDMCISCGNCSSYCEMGIDVRSYAQINQSFTRSACVGCGMCAHMCPRGVLKLENAWDLQEDKLRQGLPVVDV